MSKNHPVTIVYIDPAFYAFSLAPAELPEGLSIDNIRFLKDIPYGTGFTPDEALRNLLNIRLKALNRHGQAPMSGFTDKGLREAMAIVEVYEQKLGVSSKG